MIKHKTQKGLLLLLMTVLILSLSATAYAVTPQGLDAAISDTAAYLYQTVQDPQVGSVGGEWTVLGLARSGYKIPEAYYSQYYATVETYVKACQGVLHEKKYTEYSRLAVALTAIGKDPRDVAGYNLLTPLGDYDKTIWQGLNGPIWALMALDSGSYPMPQNPDAKTQATRDKYIDRILACQLPDGGFSLFGGTAAASSSDQISDPDITSMALQALAKYQDRTDVKKVTGEAVACLSKLQKDNGGYASWGTVNSESCAQVIVALCELGIPLDDPRFVKNSNTLLDNLLTFYQPGQGFLHTSEGSGVNQMATEQALYSLVAIQRTHAGKNSLYRMSDAIKITGAASGEQTEATGLPGKHADIKTMPVIDADKTFSDIKGHKNQTAIEALAARGIISGTTDTAFDPNVTMTRAEFAAIVVRGFGLAPKATDRFSDVPAHSWYAPYVGTADTYEIIKGASSATFNPFGAITREEAATMVARGAKLAGLDTAMDDGTVRDILAQFGDYITVSHWARASLAFCYREGILSQTDMAIQPKVAVRRCEMAEMLFSMLEASNLI